MEKNFYNQTIEEIIKNFATSKEGLSSQEAAQLLAENGENKLEAKKKTTKLQMLINQFKDFMIIILIVAALISGVLLKEWTDAFIILLVVFLNAIMGVIQESKAEEAIDELSKMSAPQATVVRDGEILHITNSQLVVGDIVMLEAGDVVPADLRLIDSNSLKIEESSLTGESVPTEKNTETLEGKIALGDRSNMAFMNTNVTYGRGMGVVVATGMETEVGEIAKMLNQADENTTPLQANLNSLGKVITVLILVIAVVIFVIGMVNNPKHLPLVQQMSEMLLTSISLAVAAIPEGLPAIVTIILALGTQKMVKHKALIRKLPAVETLGSTDIIASDKTGTLTMNQMTVEKVYENNHLFEKDITLDAENKLVQIMLLANDTKITPDQLAGDPTETALIQFSLDKQIDVKEFLTTHKRVDEVPFDSNRKLMSTVNEFDGKYLIATKGACDQLLKRVTKIQDGGQIRAITEADKEVILEQNKQFAQQALRVLAFAYRVSDSQPTEINSEAVENDLTFVGLVAMIDPERKEAKAAVQEAKAAGIVPIMITGDHPITAATIAKRLDIIDDQTSSDAVLTGDQLDQMDDETFDSNVDKYHVYARVSPEHKVRIVKAWQKKNKVVAMTGDGVNDAPALKSADIGVGMGITGTEVSKGASDMILADDNFATIVHAVKEGRKVFSNIQKSIQYLLSANLGEVLTLFIMTLLSWDILKPVQLLWINLVTDTLPAISLGLEPVEKDIMEQQPRGRKSNFFSNGVGQSIFYQGILEAIITLGVYFIGIQFPVHTSNALMHADALTMAYATLGLIQLFQAFNVKSIHGSLFASNPFTNKAFNWSIIISTISLAATIMIPGLNSIFHVTELNYIQWLTVLAGGVIMILVVELVKLVQRKRAAK
ncbi:calcium-translocating P-type ATPase, PMCA-type [Lactobacillus sp. YT155]|uniref:calcium-translocating P-type ATPase, PMCA-type n=1 Tax=Lactobacillus sp. YT155 TaxID=3060955 RepID=UPI00265E7B68|nr:calcium-translocating P-type ATPase, PMCA-type [Lactobacillus sp. YT155]MDO1605226.1 calcium-translocating P-type ATPase, PMCA-type [Lactobacillus sp. YT155]